YPSAALRVREGAGNVPFGCAQGTRRSNREFTESSRGEWDMMGQQCAVWRRLGYMKIKMALYPGAFGDKSNNE
ncbi:MAG: hypothetical protein JKY52_12605, partial [Flavobacteriales bacterium]|nr:hypothetical protein [Flavobacteriales bacterium]